jgi:tetratricopeptide (TPR) repeat protein
VKYPAVHRVLLGLSLASFPAIGATAATATADATGTPAPAAAAAAAEADGVQQRVRAAIVGLGSDDPARREQSAEALLKLGGDARPAVLRASRSDEPQLRSTAAALLMKLPWYRDDDSPAVRAVLDDYGKADVDGRREAVAKLARLTRHGFDALQRLINEEPSDDVKWTIVAAVRGEFRDTALEGFRHPEPGVENAPLLAAAGHAWMPKDAAKAAGYLRHALELDLERPANDDGEVGAAYERLQNLALLRGDYDQLAALLRMRAARNETDEEGEPSKAVLELFAAHAKFGPLAGLDKDLETFRDRLGDPRVMFALGKIYERCGQSALAAATYRSAFLVDLVSVQDRFDQGDFLLKQGWLDLAEAEFQAVFDLAPDHSNDEGRMRRSSPELDAANAHFRLSQVAAARDDDQFAADHMRQAMELHYKGQGTLNGTTEQAIWHEINWHTLRAARKRGDAEGVKRALMTFSSATPVRNPDIANDVVPMLRAAGRNAEATEVYQKVRQAIEEEAADAPDHPMPKNNLAWLAARTGEQKAEALRLAQEATRAMPDNAAFVDTLAEAQFQNGHYAEAARLEAQVVRARPTDRFLREQLQKFEAAASKGESQTKKP